MNTIAYFEIQSDNPVKAVVFYQHVFGWRFIKDDLVPIEYYRMTETEGMIGAILQRPVKTPPPEYGTNAFVCSIQVQNFDETEQTILAQGGKVALEKFAVPGKCWQGYFLDIDNNTFGIFEVDEVKT